MYQQFYGLREPPFEPAPDPRFLFLSAKHREALSTLEHGIAERNGIVVLIGEAGTGKTTLIKAVLESMRPSLHRLVHVTNPAPARREFIELLASGFGLSSLAASSEARFLLELEQAIIERNHARGVTALIIDEAQDLPDVLLEEVRLLSNIEPAGRQLLSVVLAGQPELDRRLEHSELQQRLGPKCRIGPLDIQESAAYIASRVRVAGGEAKQVFSRDAVFAVFEQSQGIPRAINLICDNALREGLATNAKPVTRKIVVDVCQRLDLPEAVPTLRPEAAAGPSAVAPLGLEDGEESPPLLLDVPQPFSWRRVFRRRRDQSQP